MSGIATLPIENPVLIFFIVLVIIFLFTFVMRITIVDGHSAYVSPTSSV